MGARTCVWQSTHLRTKPHTLNILLDPILLVETFHLHNISNPLPPGLYHSSTLAPVPTTPFSKRSPVLSMNNDVASNLETSRLDNQCDEIHAELSLRRLMEVIKARKDMKHNQMLNDMEDAGVGAMDSAGEGSSSQSESVTSVSVVWQGN